MRRRGRRGYRRRKKKRGGGAGRKGRHRTESEVKRDQEDPEEKKEDGQEGREENIKDIARGRSVMQRVCKWMGRKAREERRKERCSEAIEMREAMQKEKSRR